MVTTHTLEKLGIEYISTINVNLMIKQRTFRQFTRLEKIIKITLQIAKGESM